MNTEKIRELCRVRGMSLRRLSMSMTRMTPNGVQHILTHGSTNTKTLEEISTLLQVNPGVFFDDHPVKLEVPDEVARLREWVAIKDERIKLLEDRLRQRTDVPLTS